MVKNVEGGIVNFYHEVIEVYSKCPKRLSTGIPDEHAELIKVGLVPLEFHVALCLIVASISDRAVVEPSLGHPNIQGKVVMPVPIQVRIRQISLKQ